MLLRADTTCRVRLTSVLFWLVDPLFLPRCTQSDTNFAIVRIEAMAPIAAKEIDAITLTDEAVMVLGWCFGRPRASGVTKQFDGHFDHV